MAIRTELSLRLPNSPGALSAVCRTLADERVNIIALTLEKGGTLRLVVDNHVRARSVLTDRHHQLTEHAVLLVPVAHGPGGLAPILTLVADAGVNVEYAYAAAVESSASAAVVLGVDDAMKASASAGV